MADRADDTIRLGPLEELAGYHLRRASAVIANDFARVMAGSGVRQVLFGILSIVAANPGIHQGEIGRVLGIQRANMVSLMNELVAAARVTRAVSAEDRRAFTFTLTPAGQAAFDDACARIRMHEDRLMADLSIAERGVLLDLLARIEANAD